MSRFTTHQQFVDAEPMTMRQAIEAGVINGFISAESNDCQGYKVNFHKECATWIPEEIFREHYLPAETDIDVIKSTTRLKCLQLEKAIRTANSQDLYNEESVSTNAAMQLSFHIAYDDYTQAIRYNEVIEPPYLKEVPMDNLSFLEAYALMDLGFAVRNNSCIETQRFIVRRLTAYHPSYFVNNDKHPVNPRVAKALKELTEDLKPGELGSYEIVDTHTGKHTRWNGTMQDTIGLWRVVY